MEPELYDYENEHADDYSEDEYDMHEDEDYEEDELPYDYMNEYDDEGYNPDREI